MGGGALSEGPERALSHHVSNISSSQLGKHQHFQPLKHYILVTNTLILYLSHPDKFWRWWRQRGRRTRWSWPPRSTTTPSKSSSAPADEERLMWLYMTVHVCVCVCVICVCVCVPVWMINLSLCQIKKISKSNSFLSVFSYCLCVTYL